MLNAASAQHQTLDHAGIAARIPHAGRMCLLDRLLAWDEQRVLCAAGSHRDEGNPLREAGGLPVWAGVEYAAQAAAVHGTLMRQNATPRPAVLAALRDVRARRAWLHDVAEDMQVQASLLHADPGGAVYAFEVCAPQGGGGLLLAGRFTLMFTGVSGVKA